jgi:hypothetical protein
VGLADYKARMKEGQEAIYYITADSLAAAKNSPQLEVFKKKGIEVLLMTDRVDEWALNYLNEFDGTPMQSVAKGAVDLGKLQDEAEKKAAEEAAETFKPLLAKLKAVHPASKPTKCGANTTTPPGCFKAPRSPTQCRRCCTTWAGACHSQLRSNQAWAKQTKHSLAKRSRSPPGISGQHKAKLTCTTRRRAGTAQNSTQPKADPKPRTQARGKRASKRIKPTPMLLNIVKPLHAVVCSARSPTGIGRGLAEPWLRCVGSLPTRWPQPAPGHRANPHRPKVQSG